MSNYVTYVKNKRPSNYRYVSIELSDNQITAVVFKCLAIEGYSFEFDRARIDSWSINGRKRPLSSPCNANE